MIADWSVPFVLTTPYANLEFNVEMPGLGLYLLRQDGCSTGISVRQTTDNIPQADGSIPHHRFLTGVQIVLAIQLWADADSIACDEQLQTMLDTLKGAFRSLLNAGDNEGRIAWEPVGGSSADSTYRMLDDIRLLVYADPKPISLETEWVWEVGVTIDTRYPYAEDLTQIQDTVTTTATLTNLGNADFWPVWKVNGPFDTFTLLNEDTGLQIVYDSSLPGAVSVAGGDYAEIDTFQGTIFLNGSGADLSAGIDALNTDDFPLIPGDNLISLTGDPPDADCLYQAAWA